MTSHGEPCVQTSVSLDGQLAPEITAFSTEVSSSAQGPEWRSEVSRRMDAYRSRKRKPIKNVGQSQLPFEQRERTADSAGTIALAERVGAAEKSLGAQEQFSFTIAIGPQPGGEKRDARMEIDVSIPLPEQKKQAVLPDEQMPERYGLYPVASLDDRRLAAFIDGVCLLFGYGAFLALFSSLGGQFTLSKLSAEIYGVTLAIVYVQYFALFTIFGGTTPGMMLRGLQVTSFTGDPPTPRQMLLRSAGYILSAGTFFLGFFWAWWDEDALTWHDRISRTYLSVPQSQADMESTAIAPSHSR
jgi:uncharacterized RDD family membrane protein YckC